MKYLFLLMIAILLLLGACEIKDPVLPKWDVSLSVPLINQQFYVSDLVDSVNIVTDNEEILTITASGNAETPEFGPVRFTPNINVENFPVLSETPDLSVPFQDADQVVAISCADVAYGFMQHRFTDVHSSVESISLVFHDIHYPNGDEFILSWNGTGNWVSSSLEGLHIGAQGANQVLTELAISIQVTPALPQGTIAARLGLRANSQMGFARFEGTLNDYTMALNSSLGDIEISYPYGINQAVTLETASLRVNLRNYIGFAARFSGRIKATNEEGLTRFIDILDDNGNSYYTIPATDDGPGLSTLDFHNNVSDLLQIMPTHLEMVDGVITINSGTTIGNVEQDDKLYADYRISAPMIFTLHTHEIVIREELSLSISESNRDRIRQNALGGVINLQLKNSLPIGAWANMYFSDTPDIDVTNPDTYDFFEHMEVHASSDWQSLTLNLTKAKLDVFTQPEVYMRWTFSFEESNDPVIIHAGSDDFIHIKGMMIANILVEE